MMEQKHAYLIMAHDDLKSLEKLLQAIDDCRNDIYLHIDRKSGKINFELIKSWLKYSNLYIVPRRKIFWGDISIVKCELDMLKMASRTLKYKYYHLLSGVDYPLKSQDYIHEFLMNQDKEYLSYYLEGDQGREFYSKIRYYYPFMRWIGRAEIDGPGLNKRFLRFLTYKNNIFFDWQKSKGVDRTKGKSDIVFVKGDQWFSITDDFARFVIKNRNTLLKQYRFTNGPDEIFMQTMAYNSEFKDRIANDSLRLIDWNRGTPYEYRYADLDELKATDKLFVRKVSYSREPSLVESLARHINV